MTRWGGHVVGRISCLLLVAAGLALAGSGVADAQVLPMPPEVTLPPVTLPPVTVPPVTVPPVLGDRLPPAVGDAVDDTLGTVNDTLEGVTGLLPGTGPVPVPGGPPPSEPPGPGPGPTTPGTGTVGGTVDPGASAGGGPGADATQATASGPGRDDATRVSSSRALRRLAGSGASLAAVDLPLAPADPLDDAVQRDARHFGWPIVLGLLVVAFLAFQHRADRHERKLADAPLDQGERLRFK